MVQHPSGRLRSQMCRPHHCKHRNGRPGPGPNHTPDFRFPSGRPPYSSKVEWIIKGSVYAANRSEKTEIRDLAYRCHFIGISGVIEELRLFASPDDAAAALEAIEQLRERAGSRCVELWKDDRFIARYPAAS